MGKKAKPKRNCDRYEARALRKAAEHKPKQAKENLVPGIKTDEEKKTTTNEVQKIKVPCDPSKLILFKEKVKEKETQQNRNHVHWDLPEEQETIQSNIQNLDQPEESKIACESKINQDMTTCIPKDITICILKDMTICVPKAPRLDQRKLLQLLEKEKLDSLRKLNNMQGKEVIETEELRRLRAIPRINGNSRAAQQVVYELKKKHNEEKEIVEVRRHILEDKFNKIIEEEYRRHEELMKNNIALDELTNAKNRLTHPADNKTEDWVIPTREAFEEARLILKKFFEARNLRLSSCVDVEIRKNRLGDNYADMLSQCERNVALLECIQKRAANNKNLGYQVLTVSMKLLETILNRLRIEGKKLLVKNEDTPSKQWNRKVKRYGSKIKHLERTKDLIKKYTVDKSSTVNALKDEYTQFDTQLAVLATQLIKAREDFEIHVLKRKEFIDLTTIGEGIGKNMEELKHKNDKDLETLKTLKETLTERINERKVYDYLFKEASDIQRQIKCEKIVWRKREIRQLELKEAIRLRTGHILNQEELQQKLKSDTQKFQKQIPEVEKELEAVHYQQKRISKKLRQFTKQLHEFQYHECTRIFLTRKHFPEVLA